MTREVLDPKAANRFRTRAETIAETMGTEILEGRLPLGARLEEQALAERFAVSRTPVREAIRQLAAIGLVEVLPHRGARVMQLSASTLLHRFETMAELEASCARLAAERMSNQARQALRAMLDDGRSLALLDHREAYRLLNGRFHGAIYDGAANPHLRETVLSVRRTVMAFRTVQFDVEERLHLSQAEHEAVVAAILERDGAAAAATMRAHILSVRRTVESFMRLGTGLSI